jgi:hypothetical protein
MDNSAGLLGFCLVLYLVTRRLCNKGPVEAEDPAN